MHAMSCCYFCVVTMRAIRYIYLALCTYATHIYIRIHTLDDGEWFEGKRHGFGKFSFQDGTTLKRMWENGKMLEA